MNKLTRDILDDLRRDDLARTAPCGEAVNDDKVVLAESLGVGVLTTGSTVN